MLQGMPQPSLDQSFTTSLTRIFLPCFSLSHQTLLDFIYSRFTKLLGGVGSTCSSSSSSWAPPKPLWEHPQPRAGMQRQLQAFLIPPVWSRHSTCLARRVCSSCCQRGSREGAELLSLGLWPSSLSPSGNRRLFNPKTPKFCTLKLELKAMVRIVKVSSAWNFSSEANYPKIITQKELPTLAMLQPWLQADPSL